MEMPHGVSWFALHVVQSSRKDIMPKQDTSGDTRPSSTSSATTVGDGTGLAGSELGPARLGPFDPAQIDDLHRLRIHGVRLAAHRARTPLTLVIGAIQTALHDPDLGDDARRELEVAAAQAECLRGDIDEMAELGTWPPRLSHTFVRVGALFDQAGIDLLSAAAWRGLTYQINAVETREVFADERVITWMVDAMVRTALAMAGERGNVALECVDDESTGIRGTIVIDASAEATVNANAEELRLAAAIAAVHGGTMTHLEQDGTITFTIELPASNPDATSHSDDVDSSRPPATVPSSSATDACMGETASERFPVAEVSGPDGAPLVLLVEDDVTLRSFWARRLSAEYRVVVAGTAEEAADLIEQFEPDVIACDLVLPNRSGEQLINDLHAAPPLDDIPVIVLTGDNDEERRTRLLRDGADDYIVKPFVVEELNARIANLVRAHLTLDNLHDRAARAQLLADQLQTALDSRVEIEQAKAFIAADRKIGVDEAFEVLRRHARTHHLKLRDVAARVIDGYRP